MTHGTQPAFPVVGKVGVLFHGISRRDYFRAHAPPLPATAWRSMITQATRRYGRHGSEFDTWERDRLVLTWMARYERQWRDAYADAMLKETHDVS